MPSPAQTRCALRRPSGARRAPCGQKTKSTSTAGRPRWPSGCLDGAGWEQTVWWEAVTCPNHLHNTEPTFIKHYLSFAVNSMSKLSYFWLLCFVQPDHLSEIGQNIFIVPVRLQLYCYDAQILIHTTFQFTLNPQPNTQIITYLIIDE